MSNSRLVYSTSGANLCPRCQKRLDKCRCSSEPNSQGQSDGIVKISRETKGRKGKAVTLLTGLDLNPVELKKLGKRLKDSCASGGTLKNGIIEIQGDHRIALQRELNRLGFVTKITN